jgi:hypothetical protein
MAKKKTSTQNKPKVYKQKQKGSVERIVNQFKNIPLTTLSEIQNTDDYMKLNQLFNKNLSEKSIIAQKRLAVNYLRTLSAPTFRDKQIIKSKTKIELSNEFKLNLVKLKNTKLQSNDDLREVVSANNVEQKLDRIEIFKDVKGLNEIEKTIDDIVFLKDEIDSQLNFTEFRVLIVMDNGTIEKYISTVWLPIGSSSKISDLYALALNTITSFTYLDSKKTNGEYIKHHYKDIQVKEVIVYFR